MISLGLVFGLMGFIFGMTAMSNVNSAASRIDELEQRLKQAGILEDEILPN